MVRARLVASRRSSNMRFVLATCSPGEGPELVRTLVEEGLVACGNVVQGVRSIYKWKGEICDEAEELLFMETADERVDPLMTRLAELHSYDVPKILAFEPTDGLPAYLSWVNEMTGA